MAISSNRHQLELDKFVDDGSGNVAVRTTAILETGDIEIGAVELKNGATDDRALISDANTARAATDHVLAVQVLDAAGAVVSTSALATEATVATLATEATAATLALESGGNLDDIKTAVESTATPTTLTGGAKTVTTAGTAEALGASLATKSIYIRAKATNTSFICVGDSAVDEASNQQIVLYANDSVTLDIANRATVYIDADVNGEGVDYMAMS